MEFYSNCRPSTKEALNMKFIKKSQSNSKLVPIIEVLLSYEAGREKDSPRKEKDSPKMSVKRNIFDFDDSTVVSPVLEVEKRPESEQETALSVHGLYGYWIPHDNEFGDEDGTGDYQTRKLDAILTEEYGEPNPSESDNEQSQINSGHP